MHEITRGLRLDDEIILPQPGEAIDMRLGRRAIRRSVNANGSAFPRLGIKGDEYRCGGRCEGVAEEYSTGQEGRKLEERSRRVRKANTTAAKLSDVATRAGVSTASVSRAINFPETVSKEVRLKVADAMQELNWIPHGAARALASRRTGIIGAIIPALGHQNFATVIEALAAKVFKKAATRFCSGSRISRPSASWNRRAEWLSEASNVSSFSANNTRRRFFQRLTLTKFRAWLSTRREADLRDPTSASTITLRAGASCSICSI